MEMIAATILMLTTLFSMTLSADHGTKWDYTDPNNEWEQHHSICGNGFEQSPIDITKQKMIKETGKCDQTLPITFENINNDQMFEIFNNGHTIQIV